jgi:uncharacterized protein (TIGR03067 family)
MRTMILGLGLGLLLVAGATGGDAKSDLAKIAGSWTNEVDGKKHDFKFTKDSFTVTFEEGDKKLKVTGKFKIDPAKKPRQMDLTVTGGLDEFKDKTALAIYEFDGDTIKWCSCKPGETNRPEKFPDKEGENGDYLYLILKRVK